MKRYSKSGLFLLELMLSLLIFSVCSAICIGVFGKSAVETARSRDLNNAVILARNAAELVKCGEKPDNLSFYASDLTKTDLENSTYTAVITYESDTLYNIEIVKSGDGETVFTLECGL